MKLQLFIAYCTTVFIASIIPGPSMFLALSQGVRYGTMGGLFSALGNVAASLLQAVISYVILLQLGKVSISFLEYTKIFGAIYIIYLGWGLFRKQFIVLGGQESDKGGKNAIKAFTVGFIVALVNPKAIVFFVALFPQFIRLGENMSTRLFTILFPIGSIAFISFMLYAMAGVQLVRFIGNSPYIGKVFGACIIATGLLLLLT